MFTTVCSAAVYGLQAYLVRVEVDLAGGLPSFQLLGSLGSEVKESRERVSVAMKNSGFQIPPAHITVNLAPAGRRKDGTAFDLPIAVGLLRDMELVPEEALQDTLFFGRTGPEWGEQEGERCASHCSGGGKKRYPKGGGARRKCHGGCGDTGDHGLGCELSERSAGGTESSGTGN